MGVTDSIKGAMDLAKTIANSELYEKLVAVQMEFLDLSEKARQFQEENIELREKLRQKERADKLRRSRVRKNNAYWVGEDGPFCVGCWDGNDKAIHLTTQEDGYGRCPACDHTFCYDPAARDGHHSGGSGAEGVRLPNGGYLPPGF